MWRKGRNSTFQLPSPPKKLTTAQEQQALIERAAGHSYQRIAARCGVSWMTIKRLADKAMVGENNGTTKR